MSMNKKIMIPMAAVAIICAAIIGIMAVFIVSSFADEFSNEQLETARTVATTIIDDYILNTERASSTAAASEQLVLAIKQFQAGMGNDLLVDTAISLMESAGMDFLTVVDTKGTIMMRAHEPENYGDDLSNQTNVQQALQGRRYATIEEGPIVKLSVRCGAPIYDESNNLIGAVSLGYRLDQDAFPDYIQHLTNTDVAVFLHDTRISTTVLDANGNRAIGMQAALGVSTQVLNGENYVGRVKVNGENLLCSYFPIRDAEGIILGMVSVGLNTSETDASILKDALLMIGITVILGALTVIISWNISSRISRPIVRISGWAKQLAKGDVNIDLTAISGENAKNAKDEVSILAEDFRGMVKTIIQQSDVLTSVANGDYSVTIPVRAEDDIMNKAINHLIDGNNNMLSEISLSATQVSTGSKQIAAGAQSLAQGSSEQASAVQQLSASISEIADKTKQNADIAREAAVLSGSIKGNAEKGSQQMNQMMQAVKDISDASSKIESVIKVIDEIAFQTNILALNAAVEAARAGQHGKGFAVVAEEVRNLAAKSAEAAKDTGGLIHNSIEKSDLGLQIATDTSTSLKDIIGGINNAAVIVEQIAHSSDEQAEAIAQINIGIDQVAQVVQQNSATAEQSAAASEEMNGQSHLLAELISRFKLKDDVQQGVGDSFAAAQNAIAAPAKKVLELFGGNPAIKNSKYHI